MGDEVVVRIDAEEDLRDIEMIEAALARMRERRAQGVEIWRTLTYHLNETGQPVEVGKWRSEDLEKERKLSFKPKSVVDITQTRVGFWLKKQFEQYGVVTTNEGDIDLYLPNGERFGHILGKVAWAYHTLLLEVQKL